MQGMIMGTITITDKRMAACAPQSRRDGVRMVTNSSAAVG